MTNFNEAAAPAERPLTRRNHHPVAVGTWVGLVAGVICLIPVLILQPSRGIGVVPEMQLAASSVIGISAYEGAVGFLLGTLLHFFVSVVPAILYALVADRLPVLNRWAWASGLALGLVVFLFMGKVLLPHTAFTTPPGVSPMPFVPALIIHLVAFGLPIALLVKRRWRPFN